MADDFCPRCGRYLKDNEYQCPECGNMVRANPNIGYTADMDSNGFVEVNAEEIKKSLFEKWFFISFAITFAVCCAVTYYWRFTFLFLCFPLFLPTRRLSMSAGILLGIALGSIAGFALKYYLYTSSIII